MGLYLQTDGGDQIELATNQGWSLVGDWIDTIEGKQLKQLWEHGWAEPVSDVLAEIENATAPEDKDVADTVSQLAKSLKGIPPDSAIVVTNGLEE